MDFVGSFQMVPSMDLNIPRVVHFKNDMQRQSPDISEHLAIVCSHHDQVRMAHQPFWLHEEDVACAVQLEHRVCVHDLRTFSSWELLDYYNYWVQCKRDSETMNLWHSALEHHYQNNDHHPEHTRVCQFPGDDVWLWWRVCWMTWVSEWRESCIG